jgi:hypothetical protein
VAHNDRYCYGYWQTADPPPAAKDDNKKNKRNDKDILWDQRSCRTSEVVVGAKVADYFGGVVVLGVYGQVHGAHVVGGYFAGQAV